MFVKGYLANSKRACDTWPCGGAPHSLSLVRLSLGQTSRHSWKNDRVIFNPRGCPLNLPFVWVSMLSAVNTIGCLDECLLELEISLRASDLDSDREDIARGAARCLGSLCMDIGRSGSVLDM